MAEPFVLIGKASTVFKLIELKAKREQELNLAMRNLRNQTNLADQVIKSSLPISEDVKDWWKHQGNED